MIDDRLFEHRIGRRVLHFELDGDPSVLIAAQPTRGLDVQGVAAIQQVILEHAERLRALPADTDASPGGSGGPAAGSHDRTGGVATPAGGDTASAAPRGIEGARPAVGSPDELAEGPEAFAPEWVEGFFAVPPPPGVAAEDEA